MFKAALRSRHHCSSMARAARLSWLRVGACSRSSGRSAGPSMSITAIGRRSGWRAKAPAKVATPKERLRATTWSGIDLGLAGQAAHQHRQIVLVDGAVVVLDPLAEPAAAGVVGQDDEARAGEQLGGVGVLKGQPRLKAGGMSRRPGQQPRPGGANQLGGEGDAVGQGDPQRLTMRSPGGVVEARGLGGAARLGQRSEGVSDVGAQAIVRVTRRGIIPCSVPDLGARRRALS
jgi:hypothetical protein